MKMDINTVRTFFMWCTIINGGLLILMSLILAFAGNWVFRVQERWFPISRETFIIVIYSFLGLYKIIVISFNLVPYIALVVIR